jgi:hypothetical protein
MTRARPLNSQIKCDLALLPVPQAPFCSHFVLAEVFLKNSGNNLAKFLSNLRSWSAVGRVTINQRPHMNEAIRRGLWL